MQLCDITPDDLNYLPYYLHQANEIYVIIKKHLKMHNIHYWEKNNANNAVTWCVTIQELKGLHDSCTPDTLLIQVSSTGPSVHNLTSAPHCLTDT